MALHSPSCFIYLYMAANISKYLQSNFQSNKQKCKCMCVTIGKLNAKEHSLPVNLWLNYMVLKQRITDLKKSSKGSGEIAKNCNYYSLPILKL